MAWAPDKYDLVDYVMTSLLVIGVTLMACILLCGCHGDHTVLAPPSVIGKQVPKKCLDDPCLSGCLAGPHIFECDPPVCLCDGAVICPCEDEEPG